MPTWDDFAKRLSPREVARAAAMGGGRAALNASRAGGKQFKATAPRVSGRLARGLKAKRTAHKGRHWTRRSWTVRFVSSVDYWGPVIGKVGGRTRKAYERVKADAIRRFGETGQREVIKALERLAEGKG